MGASEARTIDTIPPALAAAFSEEREAWADPDPGAYPRLIERRRGGAAETDRERVVRLLDAELLAQRLPHAAGQAVRRHVHGTGSDVVTKLARRTDTDLRAYGVELAARFRAGTLT